MVNNENKTVYNLEQYIVQYYTAILILYYVHKYFHSFTVQHYIKLSKISLGPVSLSIMIVYISLNITVYNISRQQHGSKM